MAVPLNWLKEYVDIEWTAEELAHRLTMAGVAVEGVDAAGEDYILNLDLTPNRGDCLGIINLAREVSALSGSAVRLPEISLKENNENINDYIQVEIADADLCHRYAARLVRNCRIAPSPPWMRERLEKAGVRPINNLVDVTNYVMLECNQPLHAFDYRLLGRDHKILVRRARDGEPIATLDGVERVLDKDMLLITDGTRGVALAGIMGGENTEISDNTTDVLLESAWFLGANIRRTSRKLALRSDSSMRFEKGTDIEGVIFAVNRAAQLIQELSGGEVVAGIVDEYPRPWRQIRIKLRPDRVNYVLGTELSVKEIDSCLKRLGFGVSKKKQEIMVSVPPYRPDLQIEADLIEEVARLYGYDNIPALLPEGAASQGGMDSRQRFRAEINTLLTRDFFEVVNYSFISPAVFDRINLPADSPYRQVIRLANPLSEEQSVMRTLLLPGLLESVSNNLSRRNENLAFFETGAVFRPRADEHPEEVLKVGAIVCGERESFWLKNNVRMDFFYLKGLLEDLLQQLEVEGCSFAPYEDPSYHPGRTAVVKCKGKTLGVIGEVHPAVLEKYNIRSRACAFELDVDSLYELSREKHLKEEIARYPAVERDIAVLVPLETRAADLLEAIRQEDRELLKNVVVFDLYEGDQIPAGKKSMAFRMTLQSSQRTLTDNEANQLRERVVEKLTRSFGAVLR